MQLTMLTGKLLVPATGRCTPETWHCWLGRRLMIDGSNRPTMQAGVSRTAGGCERCKDEWKQESYGPRLRYSCWSLVCVSLTLATMMQLWSLVSGLLCVSSNLLECWTAINLERSCSLKTQLTGSEALCFCRVYTWRVLFNLCYIRLYAVQPTSICLYCMSRTSQLSFHWQWLQGV